jgi:hypothetical protein
VNLLVYFPPIVDVAAFIGEERFAGALDRDKRSRPQNFLLGIRAQIIDDLTICTSHLTIESHETIHQAACSLWVQLAYHLLHVSVVQLNRALAEPFRKYLEPEGGRHFCICDIAHKHYRNRIRREIPRVRKQGEPVIAVVRLSRHGKGSCRIVARPYARFGPASAQVHRHQFGSALVDIVLAAIRHHGGRSQHYLDILRQRRGAAAEIIGTGLQNQLRRTFFQEWSLFLPGGKGVNTRALRRAGFILVNRLRLAILLHGG